MKKLTKRERQELVEKAMPEVQKLIKKYSLQTIAYCIKRLQEVASKERKIKELEKEAERLKKQI